MVIVRSNIAQSGIVNIFERKNISAHLKIKRVLITVKHRLSDNNLRFEYSKTNLEDK